MDRATALMLFDFDLEAGRVFWRTPPKQHPRLKGQEAGGPRTHHTGKQYWIIHVNRWAWGRGKLIFLVVHGRLPHPLLDHEDGNSLNDRPSNLRDATVTQNAWNHKGRRRRILLPMGVRSMVSGHYQARIGFHGKQLHLGAFETPEAAQAAYLAKRKELYREFA